MSEDRSYRDSSVINQETKQGSIQSLVQDLKSGNISKAELFSKLAKLQTSKPPTTTTTTTTNAHLLRKPVVSVESKRGVEEVFATTTTSTDSPPPKTSSFILKSNDEHRSTTSDIDSNYVTSHILNANYLDRQDLAADDVIHGHPTTKSSRKIIKHNIKDETFQLDTEDKNYHDTSKISSLVSNSPVRATYRRIHSNNNNKINSNSNNSSSSRNSVQRNTNPRRNKSSHRPSSAPRARTGNTETAPLIKTRANSRITRPRSAYGNLAPQTQGGIENRDPIELHHMISNNGYRSSSVATSSIGIRNPSSRHTALFGSGSLSPTNMLNRRNSYTPTSAANTPKRELRGQSRGWGKVRVYSNTSYASKKRKEYELNETRDQLQSQECTFKPKIKELPSTYGVGATGGGSTIRGGGGGIPFEERSRRWREKKETEKIKRAESKLYSELSDCTFKPVLVTKKIVRSSSRNSDASYINSDEVTERLYQAHTHNLKKQMAIEMIKKEQDEKVFKECTFQPTVNSNGDFVSNTPVKSRYMQKLKRSASVDRLYTSGKNSSSKSADKSFEDYSFTPKIIGVRNNMENAMKYLDNNIFERLTKPNKAIDDRNSIISVGGEDRGSPYISHDIDDFMNSLGLEVRTSPKKKQQSGSRMRPSSAPRSRSSTSNRAPRGSESPKISAEERKQRKIRFQQFLQRQNIIEHRKKAQIEARKAELAQPHTPKLSNKSQNINKRNYGTKSFMQRLSDHHHKREKDMLRTKAMLSRDPQCTFNPSILEKSKSRQARSTTEMSRGDSLKQQTKRRMLRLQKEQEELEGLTFQPKLNDYKNRNVQGKLKILSEPETYTERITRHSRETSEKLRSSVRVMEMIEFQECTFKPKIIDAPDYVKRIARSMALTRTNSKSKLADQNSQPEWR